MFLFLQVIKCMTNQSRFTHTAWSNQCYITSIIECIENDCTLLLTVAEKFRAVISRNQERIIGSHIIPILSLHNYRNANIVMFSIDTKKFSY